MTDSEYSHDCGGCGETHPLPAYAVAQLAAGHDLIHNCGKCGAKNELLARKIRTYCRELRPTKENTNG